MKVLPDVMSEKSSKHQKLQWVGMTDIQSSLQIGSLHVPVKLDVGVNLFENNRGIHMSRLYQLQQVHLLNQKFSDEAIQNFTASCLESHHEISDLTSMKLQFHWPLATLSLKSQLAGFRQYPVQFIFERDQKKFQSWMQFEILYSSTCPQSASVSMEVIKNETNGQSFERFPATPHAQRSRAQIRVQLKEFSVELIEKLIVDSELCLGTPVQTTVKKIDEMEFARLNANNLMFCEDAARKLSFFLSGIAVIEGYSIFCEHQESLHPHNASSLSAHNYSNPRVISFI